MVLTALSAPRVPEQRRGEAFIVFFTVLLLAARAAVEWPVLVIAVGRGVGACVAPGHLCRDPCCFHAPFGPPGRFFCPGRRVSQAPAGRGGRVVRYRALAPDVDLRRPNHEALGNVAAETLI